MAAPKKLKIPLYAFKEEFVELSDRERALKRIFYKKINEYYGSRPSTLQNVKKPWTTDKIFKYIKHMKKIISLDHKGSFDKYLLSKYNIVQYSGKEYLVMKKNINTEQGSLHIVPLEKYYDILLEVRKASKSFLKLSFERSVRSKYLIPKKAIEIFIDVYSGRKGRPRKPVGKVPRIEEYDFNELGQLGIIDFQSCADGEYRWLMTYRDHATQFLHLRPLKTRVEVAQELIKIFLEFGPPSKLICNRNKFFTTQLLTVIAKQWPECKITRTYVCGLTKEITISNKKIEDSLRTWMAQNGSTNWSLGCYFIQHKFNSSHCGLIKKSPSCAVFSSNANTTADSDDSPDFDSNISIKSEPIDVSEDMLDLDK